MIYNDLLARVVDRKFSRLRKQHDCLINRRRLHKSKFPSLPYSQQDMTSRSHGEVGSALAGDMNSELPSPLQENSGDWWQVNFDVFTQTSLITTTCLMLNYDF
jgi:hypothetical protein